MINTYKLSCLKYRYCGKKWKMKNEKWKMKNEKWKMKNENLMFIFISVKIKVEPNRFWHEFNGVYFQYSIFDVRCSTFKYKKYELIIDGRMWGCGDVRMRLL